MGDFASKAAKLKSSFEAKAAALKARGEPPAPSQDEWDAGIKAGADQLAQEDAAQPQVGVTPEGLDAEAEAKAIQDQAVSNAAPKREPTWTDRFMQGAKNLADTKVTLPLPSSESIQDGVRGLNQGLYLNGSDEVAAGLRAAGGDNFAKALDEERTQNAAAAQRSPWAFNMMKGAGYVPGMVYGPASAVARGALNIGQGLLGGALGSDSNDAKQTFKDAVQGGAIATGATAAGPLLRQAGNQMVQETAPELRSTAQQIADPNAWQTGAGNWLKHGATEVVGDAAGVGAAAVAAPLAGHWGAGAAGLGARSLVKTAAGPVVDRMLPGMAAKTVSGAAGLTDLIGRGTQAAGEMAPKMAPMASAQGASRGNLLPDAALTALQHDPQQLGQYKGQFAEAWRSPEPGAVGALIARLTMTDENFRSQVLPALQKATLE